MIILSVLIEPSSKHTDLSIKCEFHGGCSPADSTVVVPPPTKMAVELG